MNISIYQVNIERDTNRVAFEGFQKLGKYQGSEAVDCKIYDKVFDGEVDCENLEDVYYMFNCNRPAGYHGRSLSVSDVVEVFNGLDSEFFFCDSFGFKSVIFDPELTVDKCGEERKIKVVLVQPGKAAEIAEIGSELEDMQRTVGGSIEAMYPYADDVAIICNEEGKINGFPANRAIFRNGKLIDIIFGSFFICDIRGDDFGSLNDEMLEKYLKLFEKPHGFIKKEDGIGVVIYG